MNLPSVLQENIIDNAKDFNVIVSATAGSGKTTTSLSIAKRYHFRKFLLLTYNSRLKLETRNKVIENDINNVEVHTFHSFCKTYFSKICKDDRSIYDTLDKNLPVLQDYNYDTFIIDEVQDLRPLYYKLIVKIIKHNVSEANIVLLGDHRQTIYSYLGADSSYLLTGFDYFYNKFQWKTNELNVSFRITDEINIFLKECCNVEGVFTNKKGVKPKYVMTNMFNSKYILNIVKNHSVNDIFVLFPSVQSKTCKLFCNLLTDNNIPIFLSSSCEDEPLSSNVVRNKVLISTFHQAKGLERKIVLVMNFDETYFKFYNKGADRTTIPNELYVAITRASQELIMVHHCHNDFVPFINKSKIEVFCDVIQEFPLEIKCIDYRPPEIKNISTTDLIKYVPIEVMNNILKLVDIQEIQPVKHTLQRKTDVIECNYGGKTFYESVSNITGIAIPNYFEYIKTGKMNICENQIIKQGSLSPELLLEMSTKWWCNTSNLHFKYKQIDKYNWLSEKELFYYTKRLDNLFTGIPLFEKRMNVKVNENVIVKACIDAVEYSSGYKNIYELKFTNELTDIHKLQLIVYMYIDKKNSLNANTRHQKGDIITFKKRNKIYDGNIQEVISNNMYRVKSKRLHYKVFKSDILNNASYNNRHIDKTNYFLYNISNDNLLKFECNLENLEYIIHELLNNIQY